jgi:hypothetical protein
VHEESGKLPPGRFLTMGGRDELEFAGLGPGFPQPAGHRIDRIGRRRGGMHNCSNQGVCQLWDAFAQARAAGEEVLLDYGAASNRLKP